MAQIYLQPPDPFNFRNPDDWSWWKQRIQHFREVSGLCESSASKQISTLLYCLEEAEAVLTSTNATREDRADYDKVIEKFDSFSKSDGMPFKNELDSIIVTSKAEKLPNSIS